MPPVVPAMRGPSYVRQWYLLVTTENLPAASAFYEGRVSFHSSAWRRMSEGILVRNPEWSIS